VKPAKIIESGITPQESRLDLLKSAMRQYAEQAIAELEAAQQVALARLAEWTPRERMLDTAEAAAYLKKSRRWLDEATRDGRNPLVTYVKIGGEKRFRKAALDDYADRNAVKRQEVKL
jgi:hypothetical protein